MNQLTLVWIMILKFFYCVRFELDIASLGKSSISATIERSWSYISTSLCLVSSVGSRISPCWTRWVSSGICTWLCSCARCKTLVLRGELKIDRCTLTSLGLFDFNMSINGLINSRDTLQSEFVVFTCIISLINYNFVICNFNVW